MGSSDERTRRPSAIGSDAERRPDATEETLVRTREDPSRRRVGRYELLDRIGRGSAGEVYRARDPTIGRTVALKLIAAEPAHAGSALSPPRSAEAVFRREVAAAGALTHPNIVTLYDAGRDGDDYYLAMELVSGITFAEELERSGQVTVPRALHVGTTVAEALDFAHARGVVHRDVKPANLLVLEDQTIKLADLGIAQLTAVNAVATDGSFLGTPNYVSPEQIRGGDVDGRADVFSLGVVLYEALTGKHPFRRESVAATLNAVLTAEPPPPHRVEPSIPPGLGDAVLRALAKDRERRFARAGDFAAALRKGAGPTDEDEGDRPKRRVVLGWSLGTGLVAVAAVLAWRVRWDGWPVGLRAVSPVGEKRPAAEVPPPAGPAASAQALTFGVMLFKPLGPSEENLWMAEALRDAFNFELSQLSGIKVFSKEFLDFVMRRRQLSEIEAMTELGIDKMISGSFTVVDGTLRVDTYVVDVDSGLLETSYPTEGRVEEFYDLRSRILLAAIHRLDLPVSRDEMRLLAARRSGDVDALKRLLEAEGAGEGAGDAPAGEPFSSFRRWLAGKRFGTSDAFAATEAGQDEEEILAVLERYRRATERGDLEELADVYSGYSEEMREAQRRYFATVRDLRVEIGEVEMAVIGDEAVVSYTRSDQFVDAKTGKPVEVNVRLTKTLVQRDGAWRILVGGD